ncbi:MAG: IS1 family transposase [bacterium]|nr:IS1 family transposase [bacterium]
MNRLPTEKRTLILQLLTEGMGINAISRTVGCSKNTVLKLLADAGHACLDYQDETLTDLPCTRLQADELWSFVYAKGRAAATAKNRDAGDVWTWVAICEDTKLVPTWMIGDRTYETGSEFMRDLALRIRQPVRLTTDGLAAYVEAIDDAFGSWMVDHRILKRRYPESTGRTGHIERQNLTMRMRIRRYARATNAFSKKLENHAHAVSLHFMVYNFCTPHRTLGRGVTPAMAAGITDHQWEVSDITALVDESN